MINDSLSENKILSQSKWGSGKGEEEVTGLFITQVKTWLTYWKQPGSDFTRQRVVCLFLTQFKLYFWTMCHVVCTWWWWYNGDREGSWAGNVFENEEMGRFRGTNVRAPACDDKNQRRLRKENEYKSKRNAKSCWWDRMKDMEEQRNSMQDEQHERFHK